MLAGPRQPRRPLQHARRQGLAVVEGQTSPGQGSRLVEDDGVDLGQPLQRISRLDQQPAGKQAPCGNNLHRRHCQPQRAGTGDDQHGDSIGRGMGKVCTRRHPAGEHHHRQDDDARHIQLRRAIGQADIEATSLTARF